MMRRATLQASAALIATWLAAFPASAAAPPSGVQSRFLYTLSGMTGFLPYSWASLAIDGEAAEVYVVSGGIVDVFNDAGMSVFDFANDTGFGTPFAIAPLGGGDLLLLTRNASGWALVRCNFRGEPMGRLQITGIPEGFDFDASSLATAGGKLYLADRTRMRVVVAGADGRVVSVHDLVELLGLSEKERLDANMRAFNVDASGNMLFTVSALFSAYVYGPDRTLRRFGVKGSTPGKFNVVGGIAADESGHLFVTDVLRCVVMVFDAGDFRFLGEFGYRGFGGAGLIAPLNIAVSNGKVYVTQSKGGVKVFGVQLD